MLKALTLVGTHLVALGVGFAAGTFALPILIAPEAPDAAMVAEVVEASRYSGSFSRDRIDSDFLHWGEGIVAIGSNQIAFSGELAPGPDYKLYLSKEFVETEADFNRLKSTMARVGDVKTFKNFVIPVPSNIDVSEYCAVIIWCETFGEFITSARYE